MHTCGIHGNAIHLNADVAAGASRTRSHDKGVRGVNSCGQTIIVVSSCERFMIVTFESQNVTNVQQCVTVLFRNRNEWRSICHFCFRGCVYHYSNSAPKKSGVSFRHEPSDVYATGRLFLICCNTSTRWDPRHGSMHVRVNDGHFPNDSVIGRFERDKIVMSAHTTIFVWIAIS